MVFYFVNVKCLVLVSKVNDFFCLDVNRLYLFLWINLIDKYGQVISGFEQAIGCLFWVGYYVQYIILDIGNVSNIV